MTSPSLWAFGLKEQLHAFAVRIEVLLRREKRRLRQCVAGDRWQSFDAGRQPIERILVRDRENADVLRTPASTSGSGVGSRASRVPPDAVTIGPFPATWSASAFVLIKNRTGFRVT